MNNNENSFNNDSSNNQKASEKLRYWRIGRAAHKLKNRSSKHKRFYHTRYIYPCLNGDQLKLLAKNGNFDAIQEINRRERKHPKNEIRKQRYLEKLAAKRAVNKTK